MNQKSSPLSSNCSSHADSSQVKTQDDVGDLGVGGVSGPVRKEVDLAYMRIVESMFRSIESLANSDEKHGDRLRLENYSYFEMSVGPLARHVPALTRYCNDAIPLTVAPSTAQN